MAQVIDPEAIERSKSQTLRALATKPLTIATQHCRSVADRPSSERLIIVRRRSAILRCTPSGASR